MLRKMFLITIFVFGLTLIQAEETIKLASLDWEPYIGEKLTNNGYVARIAVEAFKTQGYKVEINYLPWARAVSMATNGEYDGLFPEYYDEARKADFVYSDSFKGGPLGFMKRKSSKIEYRKLEDLKQYTIGTVRGYVNTVDFDSAAYLKKEEVVDDETNIKKLYNSRVDLIVIDKYVGKYIIEKQFPQYKDSIEFMNPPLEEKPLFIVFSKKAKDYEKKMKAFNAGLKEIQKNGVYQKILIEFEGN